MSTRSGCGAHGQFNKTRVHFSRENGLDLLDYLNHSEMAKKNLDRNSRSRPAEVAN